LAVVSPINRIILSRTRGWAQPEDWQTDQQM
jgi:hypothetical protein